MNKTTISMAEYINKAKLFIIPYYQRGYVWGKKRENGDNSVQFITQNLIDGYQNKKAEIFLQGVTVVEKDENIVLIDGQQRTTYFSLLLAYLQAEKKIHIKYEIRKESELFLNEIQDKNFEELVPYFNEDEKETIQDIYYFKKTLSILDKMLKGIDNKQAFKKYVLEAVNFLYIIIPEDKATKVFSMMNGNKAQMTQEELIKAEILRLASLTESSSDAEKWEQNMLRSKYAREWDRWTYWWNRKDVKMFYRVDSKNEKMLGLLLQTYFENKQTELDYSFESFRDIFLRSDNNIVSAKQTFYELRHLQKRFEDVFYSIGDGKNLHNKIGAIICLLNDNTQRKSFINKYFNHFSSLPSDYIDLYYKFIFLGLSNYVIDTYLFDRNNSELQEQLNETIKDMLDCIDNKNLYNEENSFAFLQLLRLNIEEDSKLNRAFDFSFWQKNRSLEHIFPKSKVYLKNSEGEMFRGDGEKLTTAQYEKMKNDKTCIDRNNFDDKYSEHCIGNLVLLHKNENSAFGCKTFNEKKQMYFEFNKPFNSRHLLHTISVFANSQWGIQEIQENKNTVLQGIKDYYEYKD